MTCARNLRQQRYFLALLAQDAREQAEDAILDGDATAEAIALEAAEALYWWSRKLLVRQSSIQEPKGGS